MDKNILKKFAIESRQDLMDKIRNKIKTFYVDEDFHNEQKGEVYVLSNEKHSLSLTNEEFKKRELLIKRIKELSLEQVIEEAAYTWFNRIIAIRYMEVNDMLPLTSDNQSLGIRILSSKDNTPDPEILKFTNLSNPDLDINFKKEKYVELKSDNEKFKYVLLLVCKKLGKVIPQVFDGVTDYIDILIPDNLLNDTGFITKIINEIPENNYNQVEIIGWLYQYYNQQEKDKAMSKNEIYKKEEIPYVTQLFTPDWIVKYLVENSLGRYYIEHNGNCEITKKWKYFLDSNLNITDEKIDISKLTLIDPCSGSGHILVYAFEVFYQMYLEEGYNKNDIPKLIITNNISGLEIDDRAGQLTILSILLKAREYDKNIFNKNISDNLNIVSIKDSKNINISFLEEERIKKYNIDYLIDTYLNAKEIGSLIRTKDLSFGNISKDFSSNIIDLSLYEEIKPLIHQNKILSHKYDIVVTNPPYLNASSMPTNLKNYLNKEYPESKSDLFAAFIDKNIEKPNGYKAMITMEGWMFLNSFDKIRTKILNTMDIVSLIHMPYLGKGGTSLGINFGNVAFILKNTDSICNGVYQCIRYFETDENGIPFEFPTINERYNVISKKIFKNIPNYPISYWISKEMIDDIKNGISIDTISDFTGGQHKTANNDKYLRFFWEIEYTKFGKNKKWIPYIKGGEFRKYYGNLEYVVDWSENALNFYRNNPTSNLIEEKYWYQEGITFTKITSKGSSFRYLPPIGVFDMGGPSIIKVEHLEYILGLLNSKIADDFFRMVNPTINLQNKDVKAFPIIIPDSKIVEKITNIVNDNIELAKEDWNSFETSWDFKRNSLIKIKNGSIKNNYIEYEKINNNNYNKMKNNEIILNDLFTEIYKLSNKFEIKDNDITYRKTNITVEIKKLISYAVGCMFGRYSLDKDGLIYAGGDFDKVYQKYKKADGGWAGSSLANYKYINDNGNEIELSFEVDNDNIIPITDEAYFSDDIVERFKTFIKTVYGDNTFNENMDFIAETLGKKGTETSEETIRRYFVNDFFNDHVKMYQKRPIYWLLDSGKKNGFKALIYMHRYNENLIPKARLDYLHRVQTTYEKLLSDVNYRLTTELSMTDKKEAKNRQTDLMAKLQEVKEYDEKIAHIANQRISIDLDDGVKVKYEKFKDILAKIK